MTRLSYLPRDAFRESRWRRLRTWWRRRRGLPVAYSHRFVPEPTERKNP